jgi:hypothetical protein
MDTCRSFPRIRRRRRRGRHIGACRCTAPGSRSFRWSSFRTSLRSHPVHTTWPGTEGCSLHRATCPHQARPRRRAWCRHRAPCPRRARRPPRRRALGARRPGDSPRAPGSCTRAGSWPRRTVSCLSARAATGKAGASGAPKESARLRAPYSRAGARALSRCDVDDRVRKTSGAATRHAGSPVATRHCPLTGLPERDAGGSLVLRQRAGVESDDDLILE